MNSYRELNLKTARMLVEKFAIELGDCGYIFQIIKNGDFCFLLLYNVHDNSSFFFNIDILKDMYGAILKIISLFFEKEDQEAMRQFFESQKSFEIIVGLCYLKKKQEVYSLKEKYEDILKEKGFDYSIMENYYKGE